MRQALDAVVRCNATDEAYSTIEKSGYQELFPGVIYRTEDYMALVASTARTIIKQAKEDEVFDGALPEDDASAIKTAEGIVEMAEQAWAQNVRGPEVEKILKLAAAEGNGGDPESQGTSSSESDTGEGESGDAGSESGSDDSSASEIPALFSEAPEKFKTIEPYEKYNDDRVKDITDSINWYLDDPEAGLSDSDKIEVLQNVWAFEVNHKDRQRILRFVHEAAVRKGFIDEEEGSDSAHSESDSQESEAGESEAGGSGSQGASESASEEDAATGDGGTEDDESTSTPEASSDETDADDDSESEARSEGGEGPASQAKPSGSDQGSGSGGGSAEGSDAYQKLLSIVDKELSRERVDIPSPPTEEVPELPWNWSQISDTELQDLHMQFASLAYYKSYHRSREDRIAFHCKDAADEISKAMMNQEPKGKDFKVTVAEAKIESDSRVKKWRKLQRRHEAMAHQARQEMEGYYKLVEALSRLESMRHNAWERGRR